MVEWEHWVVGWVLGVGYQTRDGVPDRGWGSRLGDRVPDKEWGSRQGMGFQTGDVVQDTGGVPDMG